MPINKETIISVFDDKLTLMQWLKTINKALEDAVLTGVEITKKGNATLSFKFTFEDGTYLETNDLVLQQGESVVNAFIQNGHLYLTLSNGTNLDAGNVKPVSNFSIDANQHLIVNYADGTSQDLGAIFNGNVNISGTLNATKITGDEIIENMGVYSIVPATKENINVEHIFESVVKNGNKITFVAFLKLNRSGLVADGWAPLLTFNIPTAIGVKLVPYVLAGLPVLESKVVNAFNNMHTSVPLNSHIVKNANNAISFWAYNINGLDENVDYYYRYEGTFLLSGNLAE